MLGTLNGSRDIQCFVLPRKTFLVLLVFAIWLVLHHFACIFLVLNVSYCFNCFLKYLFQVQLRLAHWYHRFSQINFDSVFSFGREAWLSIFFGFSSSFWLMIIFLWILYFVLWKQSRIKFGEIPKIKSSNFLDLPIL